MSGCGRSKHEIIEKAAKKRSRSLYINQMGPTGTMRIPYVHVEHDHHAHYTLSALTIC